MLLGTLVYQGQRVKVRDRLTHEILNVQLRVRDARNNILQNPARNLNYKFMVAEWLWIFFGLDDVQTIAQYNSVMRNFSDDGVILKGAYGPRLRMQWSHVIQTLRHDSQSRQAVITIWTPNPAPSLDIPCTVSMQFLIRDRLLHTIVNMRSSDVWLGLPYDFFAFSMLANSLSATLGVPIGSLTMNLGSSHLYGDDLLKTTEVEYTRGSILSPQFTDTIIPRELLEVLQNPWLSIEPFEFDKPWWFYADVLTHRKEFALEYLRYAADA